MRRTTLLEAKTEFTPRLVVTEDAVYVVHDDGFLRRWNLIGELDTAFNPIPIG